jgi:hypothetical protein
VARNRARAVAAMCRERNVKGTREGGSAVQATPRGRPVLSFHRRRLPSRISFILLADGGAREAACCVSHVVSDVIGRAPNSSLHLSRRR